jgi:hypothetical protein
VDESIFGVAAPLTRRLTRPKAATTFVRVTRRVDKHDDVTSTATSISSGAHFEPVEPEPLAFAGEIATPRIQIHKF